jgi:hypothetical protein
MEEYLPVLSRGLAAPTGGQGSDRKMYLPRLAWRPAMIRKPAIVLGYMAALTVGADPAAAQERAWCLITPGLTTTCIYYTFEQCLASRVGSSTYCGQNPGYGGSPLGTTPRDRRR